MKSSSPLSTHLQTHDFLTLLDFPDLVFSVDTLDWAAIGGPDGATIKVRGDREQLYALVDQLRAPVTLRDEAGEPRWWGYLHEAVVQEGALERGATLSGMANYVAVQYDGGKAGQQKTSVVQDSASIARRGRKERLASTNRQTLAEAEMLRDNLLATFANPVPIFRHAGSEVERPEATLTCKGWWNTLDWRYYNGSAALEQKYDKSNVNGHVAFGDLRWNENVLWQRWTFNGTYDWYIDTVSFNLLAGGAATNLAVTIWNDARTTELASAVLTPPPNWEDWEPVSVRTGGARLQITPGTSYYFRLQAPVSWGRSWSAGYGPQSGDALRVTALYGGYEYTYQEASPVTLAYRVIGFLEGGQHISLAEASCGEFITATDILVDTGLQTQAEVTGDRKAKAFIEEILANGTLNNRRLLATVTHDRRLRVDEEPVADATDAPFLLRSDGKLSDRHGNLLGPQNVAGQWCVAQDQVPSLSAVRLIDFNLAMIERATWNASDGMLMVEPRGVPGVFDLLEFQEE